HVHIATVEPNPSRAKKEVFVEQAGRYKWEYRGNRKKQSLEKLKSNVANKIMDRSVEHEKINRLIRDTVKVKNQHDELIVNNRQTKKLFMDALKRLPEDRRQWKYGYHSIND